MILNIIYEQMTIISKSTKHNTTMKLQQHFTTPEQSKRLLELGVPADTADCCIIDDCMNKGMEILTEPYSEYVKGYESISVPCWSVGRLMEITDVYAPHHIVDWTFDLTKTTYIEGIIALVEILAKEHNVDYSKLKERL